MSRPKYATGKDDNHFIPRDFLQYRCGGFQDHKFGNTIAYTAHYHGFTILLIDTHKIGGVFPDWHIECTETGNKLWLEVKTPKAYKEDNYGMTAGECFLRDHTSNFYFVVTDDDMQKVMDILT